MTNSKNIDLIHCNICSSNNFKPFFKENGYQVVRCRQCGLVFVNPQPAKSDYNIASELNSEYRDYLKQYVNNEIGHHTRAQRVLNKIDTIHKKKGRLLEIGCAAGFFLNFAKTNGWHCHGIEPMKPLADYGVRNFGIEVKNASFEQADFPNNFFDVIVAFNVLSHVKDPTRFFLKVIKLLKENGLFVF